MNQQFSRHMRLGGSFLDVKALTDDYCSGFLSAVAPAVPCCKLLVRSNSLKKLNMSCSEALVKALVLCAGHMRGLSFYCRQDGGRPYH